MNIKKAIEKVDKRVDKVMKKSASNRPVIKPSKRMTLDLRRVGLYGRN